MNRLASTIVACLMILHAAPALADGGTALVAADRDEFRITIFASPAPLRAGPIDVSVLTQHRETGSVVANARVEVSLQPADPNQQPMRAAATSDAATNKLFRAAHFTLPRPARWRVSTVVTIDDRQFTVEADIQAARALPQFSDLWLWTGWPAIAIGLFAVHRGLVHRSKRRRVIIRPRWTG